jgi:hypothetical protein
MITGPVSIPFTDQMKLRLAAEPAVLSFNGCPVDGQAARMIMSSK